MYAYPISAAFSLPWNGYTPYLPVYQVMYSYSYQAAQVELLANGRGAQAFLRSDIFTGSIPSRDCQLQSFTPREDNGCSLMPLPSCECTKATCCRPWVGAYVRKFKVAGSD